MKNKYKTKKDAYTALITYLSAPLFVAGGVFMALTRRGIREMYTEATQRLAVIIGIVGVLVVLIYSWYKMFRIFFMIINNKDYDALPDGIEIPHTAICLNCREPFAGRTLASMICPKCGGTLENLYGFYDRHPELRNEAKK
ncbi:MAG: hypothetical protein OEW04_01515 [Nitrospirota bacterium]|nr:hypothetical protein [Nitrospirota bacterium]